MSSAPADPTAFDLLARGADEILKHEDLAAHGAGSAAALHAMAEAIKLAWADRARHAGDPAFVNAPVGGLVSKAYADVRWRQFSPDRALASSAKSEPFSLRRHRI